MASKPQIALASEKVSECCWSTTTPSFGKAWRC